MTLFVAFLRGINVGGRSVKKEVLQQAFTALEFQNVGTYKQSGNVIFEAESANIEQLKKIITEKLRAKLDYDVIVLIRTIEQLKCILEKKTFEGQNPEGTSFLVTFLPTITDFPVELPRSIPKSTAKIISANGSEVFSVTHGNGEGALPNPFIESKLKLKATTRNLNILREIVKKFST
jgi:uncharacterized protein (DUF1697 family)